MGVIFRHYGFSPACRPRTPSCSLETCLCSRSPPRRTTWYRWLPSCTEHTSPVASDPSTCCTPMRGKWVTCKAHLLGLLSLSRARALCRHALQNCSYPQGCDHLLPRMHCCCWRIETQRSLSLSLSLSRVAKKCGGFIVSEVPEACEKTKITFSSYPWDICTTGRGRGYFTTVKPS